jgi:acetyl esterase/lipase
MPGQALDVYRSGTIVTDGSPVLIQIHGGSWSGGNRKQQARPLMHAMALRGWVVISIDYPLVPEATFPEPIIAVHNAIGWVRSRTEDLGIDPAHIYVTGGSSGAHLAALAALTDTHSEWTTRRETDPPIAGAIVLYGVFDLLNRHRIRDDWPIVSEGLIKADPRVDPTAFQVASPVDRVHREAPPFIIIHGRNDSLVPFAESSLFAAALREVSENSVDLVLLKGATHSFDSIPSVRTQHVVKALAERLDGLVYQSHG